MRPRSTLALALALALAGAVAAGCASGAAPAAPTPAPAAHSAADQRAAERAVPTAQDLGAAYATSPILLSASGRAEDALLSGCLGRPPTAEHETARAFSPQFSAGDAQVIVGGVTFVDTVETARDDLAALADGSRAAGCLKDSMTRQVQGAGGRADDVAVTRTRPAPGGEEVVAYRLIVQSGPLPVVVDLVSAVAGRAEVSLTFRDAVRPVPADLQDRVVRACLQRLAAAA